MTPSTTLVGAICKLINGRAFKPEDWSERGVPIIRIQNLNDGSRGFNYWAGPIDRQIPIKPGDVLLAWSGTPGTSFGVHIWQGPVGILNQHIFRVDLDEEKICKDWFMRAVNARLNALIAQAHGGVGLKHVTRRMVDELEIPLPPLDEQRRIAAILDQADDLRRKRRHGLERLELLSFSTFVDMFGDPIANPRDWPTDIRLGQIAEIVSGVTKGRKLNGARTRAVPYLAVINVQDRRLALETVKVIEAAESEIARYKLRKNDLVLTEGGDPDKLGRGALWQDEIADCIHQNHIFRVRLRDNIIDPLFANWLIGGPRGKAYFLRSAKQTTGIASINMTQLREFPLLLPPLDLQRSFAARVAEIDKLKAQHRAHLAKLDALFASLQHRAFRGEL